ncbi:SDR family NAD(P)-dependent oxidoreductase [Actinomadura sp. WMMA1423]|uniref:SDR family NAD(P)-dependent oxidoreductase n=1 Tax=Actinomadura sp. WMMA1423 TaxID=2591108 RepID=UPI0011474727|nr:SDR family NAD(P)-dependent oxidoreductase [Actinomadura sp. WMMA1423]
MRLGLGGKAVLVTGGSGLLGSAIVRRLAAEGAVPIIHYRSGATAAHGLADDTGGIPLRANLLEESEVDALIERAVERAGPLAGVVANAGGWPGPPVPTRDMTLERWRRTLDQNLTTAFLTSRAYLKHVHEVGHGSLVFVGSAAARFGEDGFADYAAAKSAVTYGLVQTLAREIVASAPRGRVNAVSPTWIPPSAQAEAAAEQRLKRALATVPLGRAASAGDVASVVAWLLSDDASGYVTGEVIQVSGGMSGRLLPPPSAEQ